jgi:hypothetical protein
MLLKTYPSNTHEEANPIASKSLLSGRVTSLEAVARRRDAMVSY